jgi:hypothetical protein
MGEYMMREGEEFVGLRFEPNGSVRFDPPIESDGTEWVQITILPELGMASIRRQPREAPDG